MGCRVNLSELVGKTYGLCQTGMYSSECMVRGPCQDTPGKCIKDIEHLLLHRLGVHQDTSLTVL